MGKTRSLESMIGLLRVRVLKGVNLTVRDFNSSDPYVILRMGAQKLKTRVIKRSINPEWNELLTLTVEEPPTPLVRLDVYDKDTFTFDDHMGFAEFDIIEFVEAARIKLQNFPDRSTIKKLIPDRQNCLAEQSLIYLSDGKILQDMVLRLKGVECGEIEVQLEWVDLPGSKDS